MKFSKTILFALSILLLLCKFSYSQTPFGINLAGAEFGSDMPGAHGVHYTYPTADELDYYKSKGFELIRLPLKWERLQRTLNGNLDTDELTRVKSFLTLAGEKDIYVIIDLHNYCRYKMNGSEKLIGSAELSIANVKDLWTKLAKELKEYSNIWGYGIMNEPHDMMQSTPWFNISQEIIYGIRSEDKHTRIIVGGDSWSSAERWMQYSDDLKNLVDSSDNLTFEAHVYFDNDASGKYDVSYDNEGAYKEVGIDRVKPFVKWLSDNNLNGFIGEYGVPWNDEAWLPVLDTFLNYLADNNINGTYWAGGFWWGNYILTTEPENGVDRPQMTVLEKYLQTKAPLVSGIEDSDSEVLVFPNPFNDHLVLSGLKDGDQIEIYDLNGILVQTSTITNGMINKLDRLVKGIYFIKYRNRVIWKVVK